MQQDMPWPEIGADAGGLEHRHRLPPWRRHLRPRPRPSAGPPGRSPLRRGDRPPAWAGYALAAALALAGVFLLDRV